MPASSTPSRYTVRALDAPDHYCVWDNERNALATSPNGDRRYHDLSFAEAFRAFDQLSGQGDPE
jgi:hypothetical protein